jgi:GDP-4-dehydro-6-deoxy-D-mannose reductase
MASVGKSFGAEKITASVNIDGTLNILDACRDTKIKRLIVVSSADCYGAFTPKTKTLTERQPLNPQTPYAISKATAERMALYYFRQYDLPVLIARSFNHAGPRQDDRFVIASFAKQVANIDLANQKPIMKVGDLSAKRDFSDVRDIVDGYRLMATNGQPGDIYQLCSGKAVSIQRMLDLLLTSTKQSVSVKIDKNRLRKADIPLLRGSHAKATRQLGYKPTFSLEQTLVDTFNYWRDQLSK